MNIIGTIGNTVWYYYYSLFYSKAKLTFLEFSVPGNLREAGDKGSDVRLVSGAEEVVVMERCERCGMVERGGKDSRMGTDGWGLPDLQLF